MPMLLAHYISWLRLCVFFCSSCPLQIGDIFTLNYVPWGNAELRPDGKIECQHGELECTLNTVEACMLYYHPTE